VLAAAAGCVSTASTPSQSNTQPIKVGAVLTMSGPAAQIGLAQLAGIQIAVDKLNSGKGVLGRKLQVVPQDDAGDATKAAQAARDLVDQENVDFVVGPTLSAPGLAAVPVTTAGKKLSAMSGVVPDLGDATKYPYNFRMSPAASLQAQTFVAYMQKAGLKRAGLLAVNTPLGTSNIDAFKAALGSNSDIKIADAEFHDSGQVDLVPQLTKLKNSGADTLLVLNTAVPDQIAAIKARRAVGWTAPALGFSTMADPAVSAAVGADGMKDVYAGQQYKFLTKSGTTQATKDVLAAYRNKVNQHPLKSDATQVLGGYDFVMLIANAFNKVGSLDPDKARKYLETNQFVGAKAIDHYDASRHDGEILDTLVFVLADSFDDGFYTVAPGQ